MRHGEQDDRIRLISDVPTPREIEVARLVSQGLMDKEIAPQLGIRPSTVKQHVRSLCKKLGLANRVQVAVWIVRQETELRTLGAVPVSDDEPACRYGLPPGWGIVDEAKIALYRSCLLSAGEPHHFDKSAVA